MQIFSLLYFTYYTYYTDYFIYTILITCYTYYTDYYKFIKTKIIHNRSITVIEITKNSILSNKIFKRYKYIYGLCNKSRNENTNTAMAEHFLHLDGSQKIAKSCDDFMRYIHIRFEKEAKIVGYQVLQVFGSTVLKKTRYACNHVTRNIRMQRCSLRKRASFMLSRNT